MIFMICDTMHHNVYIQPLYYIYGDKMKPEIETVVESLINQNRKILELALVSGESEQNSLELSLRIWKDGAITTEISQKGSTDGLTEEDRIEYRIPCENLYNFVDVSDDETDEDEYRRAALSSHEYQEKIDKELEEIIKELRQEVE